jgi:alpha-L-fucosidase 2
MWLKSACAVLAFTSVAVGVAPAGFPASGNGLWYSAKGVIWSRDYLPVGNGFLGGKYTPVSRRGFDSRVVIFF